MTSPHSNSVQSPSSDHSLHKLEHHALPKGELSYYSGLKESERPSLRSTQGWNDYGPMTIDPSPYNVFDTPAPRKIEYRSPERRGRWSPKKSALSATIEIWQSPKKKVTPSLRKGGTLSPAKVATGSNDEYDWSGRAGSSGNFVVGKRHRGAEDDGDSDYASKKVARSLRK
ncbi:MAG: hypothetical protein MMC33_010174 [Icmadophila ericetorum]|nr:hypothetical protein [Icmadophila ericetorum]